MYGFTLFVRVGYLARYRTENKCDIQPSIQEIVWAPTNLAFGTEAFNLIATRDASP